jgi:hypothetical protein
MRIQLFTTGLVIGICLIGLNGCYKSPAGSEPGMPGGAHDHVHLEEGPHGGHIIEIGAKDHHAELVHDEGTHKVGIYVLEGDAKTSSPIEAKTVVINVAEDGVASQFELPAVPQSGDGENMSSYYEIVSEPLCKIVCGESEAKSVQARVSIKIGERPYVGLIETAPHDHDHGHAHEGEHAEEHADGHEEMHDAEHADEHAEEKGTEPSAAPTSEPGAEPATEPSAEPGNEPAAEPAQPGTESAAAPGGEAAAEPGAEK